MMIIWVVCSLVTNQPDEPECLTSPPFPEYHSERQCIEGERALFEQLKLPDPFNLRLIECRPTHSGATP